MVYNGESSICAKTTVERRPVRCVYSVLPECAEQRDNQVWSRHVVMVTSEALGDPSRRMRCLMSGPVDDLWPRGRPDDATNTPAW